MANKKTAATQQLVDIKSPEFEKAVGEVIEKRSKAQGSSVGEVNQRFEILKDGWIRDIQMKIDFGPSSKKVMKYADAEKYCAEAGGRLPTLKELHSIVDYEKYSPAVDTRFFGDTKTDDWYWTSTKACWAVRARWCVSFYGGNVNDVFEDYSNYVRPCRASQ